MFYITGDTHGQFKQVARFSQDHNLTADDTMIILGDAGINYFGNERDRQPRKQLAKLPITVFCIHGNHEMRPSSLDIYREITWRGGIVYVEDAYPNILFAKDGEIFDCDGTKAIVIGGAYSVDKFYRLENGWSWFEDEQPNSAIKAYVEQQLERNAWTIDVVLSHTCPLRYEPTEAFIAGVDQKTVDKSTEIWLGCIEEKLEYRKWYCGHYHTEKRIDKLQFMFHDIEEFFDESDICNNMNR